ncbi:MAG: L-threonine 3-dehydrogenase, partial [Phycisphaerales bacterium]|nr:L-threonine 3-dehydrogenase [Phycisphaerales bacterium]
RPSPGPNDVAIRVRLSAICGTDVHIWNWDEWAQKTVPVGLVTGHEFFGEIVALGDEVTGLAIGDRVTGEGHITCGACRNCRAGKQHLCRNARGVGVQRDGSFAEYLVIPARNVFRVPPDVPDEIASIFDPLGNAVHTALSFDLVGEDVLITGAGPIGLMAAAVCRKVGARHIVITDVNPRRLALAERMGATLAIDVTKRSPRDAMAELGMREGFDVGLEMSGNARAFESMLEAMNHGGRVASLGIFSEPVLVDWSRIIFKGLIVKGIYGREMFETWYKMTSLVQSGLDVEPVITHRLPIAEFERGFAALRAGEASKVILRWD